MTEPSAGRREEIIAQFSEYIVGEGRLPQNFYGRDAVIRMVDAALEAQPVSRNAVLEEWEGLIERLDTIPFAYVI